MISIKLACAAWNWHDLLFHIPTGKLKNFMNFNNCFVFFCLFIYLWLNKKCKKLWLNFTFHIQRIDIHFKLQITIPRLFRNAPFYIHFLSHMVNLRMFSLSFFILLHNGPWFAIISTCSCCSFWRNTDVSLFQQLSPDKCKFNLIWNKHLEVVAKCLN